MSEIVPITVANGDGIGPEIMDAVMYILRKAEAKIRLRLVKNFIRKIIHQVLLAILGNP